MQSVKRTPGPNSLTPSPGAVLTLLLAGLCLLRICPPSVAQQPPTTGPPGEPSGGAAGEEPRGVRWSLGLGTVISPEPYLGADDEVIVFPVLVVQWKRLAFEGFRLAYTLGGDEGLEVRALAQARFLGYEADDSPALGGMEDREISMDLGFDLTWEPGPVGLETAVLVDALGRSDGQEARLGLIFPRRLGRRWRIEPGLGVAWQSSDFTAYYYGVRPDEARPGRPAYEPGDVVNLDAGVEISFFGGSGVTVLGELRYTSLASEIEDSPIVDDGETLSGFLAAVYRF